MGFYSKEPVNPEKTTVTYLWTGLRTPGIFIINVEGDAPNFSSAFSLMVVVMGLGDFSLCSCLFLNLFTH